MQELLAGCVNAVLVKLLFGDSTLMPMASKVSIIVLIKPLPEPFTYNPTSVVNVFGYA